MEDDRVLPFVDRGKGSCIVVPPLVHAAAMLPLNGQFDLPSDRVFDLAAQLGLNSEQEDDIFNKEVAKALWKQDNHNKRSSSGKPICLNCGLEFSPDDQNPFKPFTCSYHPRTPQSIGNTGARGDFAELWYFPCCGKREVGSIDEHGSDVAPTQTPGCLNTFHRADLGSIFVSYARADGKFAWFLETELKRRGLSVWRDTTDIVAGDAWRDMIEGAIRDSALLLFLTSPRSMASPEVARELKAAGDMKKLIVPILLEDCELPPELGDVQWLDWRTGQDHVYHSNFGLIKEMVTRKNMGASQARTDDEF